MTQYLDSAAVDISGAPEPALAALWLAALDFPYQPIHISPERAMCGLWVDIADLEYMTDEY